MKRDTNLKDCTNCFSITFIFAQIFYFYNKKFLHKLLNVKTAIIEACETSHEDLPDNFMKINTFFNCSRFYDEFQSIFSIQLKLKEHFVNSSN